MTFSRNVCGKDFIRALQDGRVTYAFMDKTIVYEETGEGAKITGALDWATIGFRSVKMEIKKIIQTLLTLRPPDVPDLAHQGIF